MNTRIFLKSLAALVGGWTTSKFWRQESRGATSDGELFNWARNHRYSTKKNFKVASVAQVQQFVKEHPALKALGTRHCFNGIADSLHQLISLRQLNRVLKLDSDKRTVTVEAGISYGQLSPWLDQHGWGLHNLASLPHISVAGACATGTHGSGVKNGNLATAVAAMEIVNAKGERIPFSREKNGETFSGVVVHLGALGIVTKVTLDVEPTYQARQYVYQHMPMSEVYENFETIMSRGHSVSLFTGWQEIDEVWIKVRTGEKFEAPSDFFGARRADRDLHPIAALSAENCTPQLGVPGPWHERLPHFRMGFTPSSGKELQSEYFVGRDHAVDAIQAVERLRDQIRPYLMISELRTIAADSLWMSPCYHRPSLAIHFTWKPDWKGVRKLLPLIERELSPYQVRPHWGKLFTIQPVVLQSAYERLADFKELVRTHDPEEKFRNAFLAQNLYS